MLGISELFHAIGMRSVEKSLFPNESLFQPLMILALVLGISLQVAVTEFPVLTAMFETVQLSLGEVDRPDLSLRHANVSTRIFTV